MKRRDGFLLALPTPFCFLRKYQLLASPPTSVSSFCALCLRRRLTLLLPPQIQRALARNNQTQRFSQKQALRLHQGLVTSTAEQVRVCVLTSLPPPKTLFEINMPDICHQKLVIITLSLFKSLLFPFLADTRTLVSAHRMEMHHGRCSLGSLCAALILMLRQLCTFANLHSA